MIKYRFSWLSKKIKKVVGYVLNKQLLHCQQYDLKKTKQHIY